MRDAQVLVPRSVLYHVTVAGTARRFLLPQLSALASRGHRVTLAASGLSGLREWADIHGIQLRELPASRGPALMADATSLSETIRLYRGVRPDIAVYGTPKAALLSSIASRVTGVPARLYVLHGLRMESAAGVGRSTLAAVERLTMANSTRVVAVSRSLRDAVIDIGLAPQRKVEVIAGGSVCGVEVAVFAESPALAARSSHLRAAWGLSGGIVLFVGRVSRDKGFEELVTAWVRRRSSDALVVVGELDTTDPPSIEVINLAHHDQSILLVGASDEVPAWMSLADVVVLPTYREGFPQVLLEAAAAGNPAVATRTTGCVDAIADGVTGILTDGADPDSMIVEVDRLLASPSLRQQLGQNARERVVREFSQAKRSQDWVDLIESLDPPASE